MSNTTKFFDLVRKPLSAEQLDIVLEELSIATVPRYSVTPGTILTDMWVSWFAETGEQGDLTRGFAGRIEPINALLGLNVDGDMNQSFSNWFPKRYAVKYLTSDTKKYDTRQISAPKYIYISNAFVLYRNNSLLPCHKEKCTRVANWRKIEHKEHLIKKCDNLCKEAAKNAKFFTRFLDTTLKASVSDSPFWIRDTLGVTATWLIKHVTEYRKHLFIPVDPVAVAKWPIADFLDTFSHIESYLKEADRHQMRLIYVLAPIPPDDRSEDLQMWLIGEAHYRIAMELFLRRGWPRDSEAIKWLVRQDSDRNDPIAKALFPEDKNKTWPRWFEELQQRYKEVDSWTYCAYVSKNTVTPDELEFAVTPIASKLPGGGEKNGNRSLIDRYKEPALPVEPIDCSALKRSIATCIQAVLPENDQQAPDGWSIMNVNEFVAFYPAMRVAGKPLPRSRG